MDIEVMFVGIEGNFYKTEIHLYVGQASGNEVGSVLSFYASPGGQPREQSSQEQEWHLWLLLEPLTV